MVQPCSLVTLALCIIALEAISVTLLPRDPLPAISAKKPAGQGYSPCLYNFNPAWLQTSAGLNRTAILLRAALCPYDFGGVMDHILFAYCNADGTCEDVQNLAFPFEPNAQDPRVVFEDPWYYLFYYANGSGERTVYLRRTKTPLKPASWELMLPQPLAWHRNGCVFPFSTTETPKASHSTAQNEIADSGRAVEDPGLRYVIFGESPPLPGLGIGTTTDFKSFTVVNSSWLRPLGANDTLQPEIVIEASTPPVRLSTGDYFHLYSAGTPGWVQHGNYTAGWLVLAADDPTIIVARSAEHICTCCGPFGTIGILVPVAFWKIYLFLE
eukprot:TRINITY_DN2466_c0_g1_i2.p1 TRINITY_DN2466_c0_g1~~TRINITY_DN2466_c0_g1_i2.p1  ORF type:complete len:326 (-),score=31.93 TRINITY_DN2466_c0_g1_i2:619-1596(-)